MELDAVTVGVFIDIFVISSSLDTVLAVPSTLLFSLLVAFIEVTAVPGGKMNRIPVGVSTIPSCPADSSQY